jgi:hypothetical protein
VGLMFDAAINKEVKAVLDNLEKTLCKQTQIVLM